MSENLENVIARYMDANFPILYVNSFEETKITKIVEQIAERRTIFYWNRVKGFGEYNAKKSEWNEPISNVLYKDITDVFEVKQDRENEWKNSILIITDAHLVLENKQTIVWLKEMAIKISEGLECCIILISPIIKIPIELERYITIVQSDYLKYDEICKIIKQFILENELRDLIPELLNEFAISLKGLTEYEINSLLALAVADEGELTRKGLKLIFEQKKQVILKSGILEMISLKETIDDIGGLENLKNWLKRKARIFKNIYKAEEFGVDIPKGVLIGGIPGCGKSLCAKATAKLFEVPLLRLDVGKLMGKYLGESEANLHKAIKLAETISPCILWVDEIEKAFAGAGNLNGHEVTERLFGTFLTWLQEKTETVFVVATANDITKLPAELLRKGRFDEIFYVGLPNDKERRKILEIHIGNRRKDDLKNIDIGYLASKTEGYSGAEIEGIVKEAIELAFVEDKKELTTKEIEQVIKDTSILSEIMKDQVKSMIEQYEKRR